jgi:hypothetical protein
MSFTPRYQPSDAVYCPSRADQRIVRQVLANLHDGEPSADLENIVSGPLARTVRFLGAVRGLTYIIVARSRDGGAYSFCGPDIDSAEDLSRRVLDLPPPHALPQQLDPGDLSAECDGRTSVLRDAVERIAMALKQRDDCVFVLASQVDGEPVAELDYSHSLKHEIACDWVRWFLGERLHVEPPPAAHLAACNGSR